MPLHSDIAVFGPTSPIGSSGLGAFEAVPDIIARRAAANPHRPALLCGGDSLAWGEFAERVDRVANTLITMGVRRGDKVVLLASPSISAVIALCGILRAGGCLVPLPTTASGSQLELMARDADARAILVDAGAKAQAALFATQVPTLLPDGFRVLTDLEGDAGVAPIAVQIQADDPFNIIYSSGTTGNPNGIIYDHAVRWFQAVQAGARRAHEPPVCIITTPLYSNTTLAGGLLQTLTAGGSLVLLPKFDVRAFLSLCQSERVTQATLVPVQCQRLLAYPQLEDHDLSRVNLRVTAAPLTPDLKRQLAKRWQGGVVETYGFTELGAGTLLDIKGSPDKLHTVGRPRPFVELKIIDENDHPVPTGTVGEIVGSGSTMMRGYYNKPELTQQQLWCDADGKPFLRSGDMGCFDDDGFLAVVERKKDVIISGGFNIYPADLEAVIARHADVGEVAVIGVPSEQWGESPLALVVLRTGSSLTEGALRDWANAQVGKTQRLCAVAFRDALPRSSIGKLLKKDLRAAFWSEAGRHV